MFLSQHFHSLAIKFSAILMPVLLSFSLLKNSFFCIIPYKFNNNCPWLPIWLFFQPIQQVLSSSIFIVSLTVNTKSSVFLPSFSAISWNNRQLWQKLCSCLSTFSIDEIYQFVQSFQLTFAFSLTVWCILRLSKNFLNFLFNPFYWLTSKIL